MPSEKIGAASEQLGLDNWDFHRTRWTIRDADRYQALLESATPRTPSPAVFGLPTGSAEPDRVAAMMPFGAEFSALWDTIKAAAADGGWKCQRADDTWEHSAIIDDVVSLIWRSRVVVCDLTKRNANVFYDAGIAHALGREVVLVTQSPDDVPFDLKHLRSILYLNNTEGWARLRSDLFSRLSTLMAK